MDKINEAIKITKWYYSGMNQIGGEISLFYCIGRSRICELYNVNYNDYE